MNNSSFEQSWKDLFLQVSKDDNSDYQISLFSKIGFETRKNYFLEYLPKNLIKGQETKSLDVGCGSGVYVKLLSQQGFKAYGVDNLQTTIEIAKRRADNPAIEYSVGNIYAIPFPDNFFDLVICIGVFQNLDQPLRALKELKRVLKSQGLIIIMTLNSFSLRNLITGLFRKQQEKKYNPYIFKKMLFNEGWINIKLKGIYIFPISSLNKLILNLKIYRLLNLFFILSKFISHSFYIQAEKPEISDQTN